ncbi:uncharacterized protein LOC125238969 [Leguminivora glycinivorella]|uniref:uncharacterized protein LOC125238969 n=1 Tax=Leguminivora glycinivorella TaxID=1035111 RepID=UPI00200F9D9B|nr:uncharacterized protein LOC125238969 [Leguminivora glycinivorella]
MDVECSVAPVITSHIPHRYIRYQDIPFPSGIILADPKFNEPSSIDILVGAEIFWDVLGVRKIELGPNQPTLRDSKFGWLVCGAIIHPKVDVPQTCMFTHELPSDSGVDISRFWELDSVAPKHKFTPEENACEEHFQKTTTRDADGRFMVSMPLKESPEVLGDSYQRALATFLSVERRLEPNPTLKDLYVDFLDEYESLGHMSKCMGGEHGVSCFLPHHGVLRDSTTTKLRVVFNGSAPTTSGKSFNDIQRGKRDSGTYSWLSVALCTVEGESSRLSFSWSQR